MTGQGLGEVRVCFCVEAVTWNPRAGLHHREQRLTNSGSSCPLYDLLLSFSVVLTLSGQTCSLAFLLHSQTGMFFKTSIIFQYINFFCCILLHEFYTAHKSGKYALPDFCFLILILTTSTRSRG